MSLCPAVPQYGNPQGGEGGRGIQRVPPLLIRPQQQKQQLERRQPQRRAGRFVVSGCVPAVYVQYCKYYERARERRKGQTEREQTAGGSIARSPNPLLAPVLVSRTGPGFAPRHALNSLVAWVAQRGTFSPVGGLFFFSCSCSCWQFPSWALGPVVRPPVAMLACLSRSPLCAHSTHSLSVSVSGRLFWVN